ncbi:MAG: HAD-IC family P-type ATPase, partial [Chloroflexota bacterium]
PRRAGAGERVLLFARAPDGISGGEDAPRLPEGLTPVALIGLEEEVRPDAGETLGALAEQGVSVKVISGDSPRTVLAIARRVGLPPTVRAISGPELAGVDAGEWPAVVGGTTVFGRVSPEGKVEIIRTLQSGGHFVAMAGDGVNDVLALKQAQVGIAMRSGSPAARTVADVVLLEDSFAVLPRALEEGRRIVNSMMLLIKLFLVRDAATLGLILACGLGGAPFPLLPPHAAVVALLTVGIPSLFVVGWASPGTPRRESPREMAGVVVMVGATSALAIMTVYLGMLVGLGVGVAEARTGVVTAAMASGLLALVVLWHPLDAPLDVLLSDRRVLLLAAGSLAVYLVALQSPVWQRYFELTPLPAAGLAGILAVVAVWFTGLRVVARSGVVGGRW